MSTDRDVRVKVNVAVDNAAAKRAMEEIAREAGRTETAAKKAREELQKVGGVRPAPGSVGAGPAFLNPARPAGAGEAGMADRFREAGFERAVTDLTRAVRDLTAALGQSSATGTTPGAGPAGATPAAAGKPGGGLSKWGGRLAALAAVKESLAAADSFQNHMVDPKATAADAWDGVAGRVPYVGSTVGRFVRTQVERSRMNWSGDRWADNYSAALTKINNAPMNLELTQRDAEFRAGQRLRDLGPGFARDREGAALRAAVANAQTVGRRTDRDREADDRYPEVAAAREAARRAEAALDAARAEDRRAKDFAGRESGMADAAFSKAARSDLAYSRVRGRAGTDPTTDVALQVARVDFDQSAAAALTQGKAAQDAINASREKSLALIDAEYQKNRAVTDQMRAQVGVLREKEEKVKAGSLAYAGMGPAERETLRQAAQMANKSGLESLPVELRQTLLSNPITSEFFGKKGTEEIQGDKGLQDLFKLTGQQDLKTIRAERVKVQNEYTIKVDFDGATKAAQDRAVEEAVERKLKEFGIKTQRVQNTQTVVQQGARQAQAG